jgi:hypothetical protein
MGWVERSETVRFASPNRSMVSGWDEPGDFANSVSKSALISPNVPNVLIMFLTLILYPLFCLCLRDERVTGAARKLVACVVRTKACRSDQPGNVFFARRFGAGRRHRLASCGGTSPSRRSAGRGSATAGAALGGLRQSDFPFGARQRRARGEMLERGRRDCRRHPFGARGAAAARRSERGGAPTLCHRRLHQDGHESDRCKRSV